MLAKKIHAAKLIDFSDETLVLHPALEQLCALREKMHELLGNIDEFDRYVVDYFFEGLANDQDHSS
jgi:predicted component of type VI protein secretion system